MPVVRNVPVFPDRDLKPGDTWTALGEEKHDFRRSYGIPEPYRIPFTAGYEYLGNMTYEGVERPAFKAAYTLFYQPPRPSAYTKAYPAQIMGHSEQVVYWDAKAGQPAAYTETFKIIIEQSDGTTVEFTGSAEGKVIEAQLMDRDAVERKVKDEIARLGIGDANVRQDEKGVVISLENIQFLGDSSVLQPSEKEKLQKISQILSSFPDRDIMVTGHTALAATEERRQVFSEERARVVGDYLISTGVVTAERMTTRGMGAKQPLADNSTEAGMRRNRRVEIMILEN
jgi:outer membrane protein OmpA-like peptidoglycan-associated protein